MRRIRLVATGGTISSRRVHGYSHENTIAMSRQQESDVEHINSHDGVRWATFDQIAGDFAHRQSRQ